MELRKKVVAAALLMTLPLGGTAYAGVANGHGKACESHGKAGQHGKGAEHGKAGQQHGKSCDAHGKGHDKDKGHGHDDDA